MNENNTILGYRIYIDDILTDTVAPEKCEAIIDSIREEGNHKIKLRTYDQYGESEDSNVIIARFRRQQPVTTQSDSNSSETKTMHRSRSEDIVHSTSQAQIMQIPLRHIQSEDHKEYLSNEENHAPTIVDRQQEKINNDQSPSSARSPLLAQHNAQIVTTPERNMVRSNYY